MSVSANRALGIVECRGMVALLAATDRMLKTAQVQVCGQHGIGSGWVTVLIEGETAAVNTAIRAGRREVESRDELIVARVVPRPEARAMARMPHGSAVSGQVEGAEAAVGVLETRGVTPLIAGADAMVKAADVDIAGWACIGGALAHVLVCGEVSSVQAAMAAGAEAARKAGEYHAELVIPQPAPGIKVLYPPPVVGQPQETGALGVVETTGYAGAVSATDGMVKAAETDVVRLAMGSGGRVAVLIRGRLDGVTAAVAAGSAEATRVGECNGSRVISRPDPQVMACFASVDPPADRGVRPAPPQEAMGLLETRTTVGLVKALDEMLKSAEVAYEGRYKVGYFLTATVIRGDVGAVKSALDRGAVEAEKYGELVAAHLIPLPFTEMEERLPHS